MATSKLKQALTNKFPGRPSGLTASSFEQEPRLIPQEDKKSLQQTIASGPEPKSVSTESVKETRIPSPDTVKQRVRDKQAVSKALTFTGATDTDKTEIKKPDAYLSELNQSISDIEKINLEEPEELQTRLGELKDLSEAANRRYQQTQDRNEWLQVAEMLGHAFTQLGAGAYGLKHGIDMSGLKFEKNDWAAESDKLLRQLNSELDQYSKERQGIKSEQKDLADRRLRRQSLLSGLRDKVRGEKARAQELGLKQSEAEKDRQLQLNKEKAKQLAAAAKKQGKLDESNIKFTRDLIKDVQGNASTKEFTKVADSYEKIKDIVAGKDVNTNDPDLQLKPGTPAGDLGLVFMTMKMFDPTSVVREGEQALAVSARGIPDSIRNWLGNWTSGKKLTPSQRKNFLEVAKGQYRVQADTHKKNIKPFLELADEAGVDPNRVFNQELYNLDKTRTETPRELSEEDKAAKEWAEANPNDPRAEQILNMIGR